MNLLWAIILITLGIIYFGVFIYASMVIYSDMGQILIWKRPVYALLGGFVYTIMFIVISPMFALVLPFWLVTEISKNYKNKTLLEYIKNKLNIKERDENE